MGGLQNSADKNFKNISNVCLWRKSYSEKDENNVIGNVHCTIKIAKCILSFKKKKSNVDKQIFSVYNYGQYNENIVLQGQRL